MARPPAQYPAAPHGPSAPTRRQGALSAGSAARISQTKSTKAAALRTLPVGTAYAVWVSIGALGVALAGILTLGESASALRLGFLALILVGVVGLRLVES